MKFENLSQYLLYKPTCPFCYQDLDAEVYTAIKLSSSLISDSERKADGLHYIFTTRVPPDPECATDFKITLRMDGKLSYVRANPKSYQNPVQRKHFIAAFNNSHTQITQSCINSACILKYIKQSLPLYLDGEGLNSPQLYCESFEYNDYIVSNNYVDDITEIYVKDSPVPPVKIRFYELTDKSTPLVFDRINVAVTFS